MDGQQPKQHPLTNQPSGPPSPDSGAGHGVPPRPMNYGGGMFPGMTPEVLQAAQLQMLQQWRAQMQLHNPPARPTAPFAMQGMMGMSRPPQPQPVGRPVPVPIPMMNRPPMNPAPNPGFRPAIKAEENSRPSMRASPLLNPQGPPLRPPMVPPSQTVPPMRPQMGPMTELPIFKAFHTVFPYNPAMSETQFLESLGKFMALINLPLRKVPQFRDRSVPMHNLYRIVTSFGGFQKVSDANQWAGVAMSLQFSPVTPDLLGQLKSLYFTLFYAYEQVFFHRIPLDKVICKSNPECLQFYASLGPHALLKSAKGTHDQSGQERIDESSPPPSQPKPKTSPVQRAIPVDNKPRPAPEPSNIPKTPVAKALTRDEVLQGTLRTTHLATRRIRSIPIVGKVSYEEITLMLASTIPEIQTAALGILERLSFDASTANVPSENAVIAILDVLCCIFTQEVALESKRTMQKPEILETPFEFLLAKLEAEAVLLDEPVAVQRLSRLESIVNILRNWSLRPEMPAVMAKNDRLLMAILMPSLSNPDIWQYVSLDVYQGLWLVLLQLVSFVTLTNERVALQLLHVALDELERCLEKQVKLSYVMHPAFMLEADNTESIKKAIIQFIKASNQIWRQLPSHAFVLMDFTCRMLSNLSAGGMFDVDDKGLVRSDTDAATTMDRVLETLWQYVEHFVITALGLAFLIDKLLKKEARQAAEFGRYADSVLHNVQFGLPDGGYLELSLLTLLHALRRCEPSIFLAWSRRSAPRLISYCDSLRRLWLHPHPDPKLDRSPLSTQPFTAASSQPYLVLIRLYAILGHLAFHLPQLEGVGMREAEMVVGWIASPVGSRASRELLQRNEFVQVAELLLSSISV